MGLFSKISQSGQLVGGMLDRLGVAEPITPGTDPGLEATRHRAMVMRCSACPDQSGCRDLQARVNQLAEPPEYCQNRAVLAQMKAG